MKIVLFDYLYDTKQMTEVMIQGHGQHRLDQWLGKDKVKFEVKGIVDKTFRCTLWREYGIWYHDPGPFSSRNDSVVDVDAQIFLGRNYQTGTEVDFSEHPGWCIWYPDIETIFLPEMKKTARDHHGSRIKRIEVDNNLDHIDMTITYI